MEIPAIYRETRTRVEFGGWFKQIEDEATGRIDICFKFPGGEIPYKNSEDFFNRLVQKGFKEEEIEIIVGLLLNTVATEATISSSKVCESVF